MDVSTKDVISVDSHNSSESLSSQDGSSTSPSPTSTHSIEISNKSKKKQKLSKDISLMMVTLNSLETPEEKIAALCKKYSDLLQDYKVVKKQLDSSNPKIDQLQKEVVKSQAEKRKLIVANSRLESLSRELQKLNTLEKKKAHELSEKLSTSVIETETQMKNAIEGNARLSEEYSSMQKEFNNIASQFKDREQNLLDAVGKCKLEAKLQNALHKKNLLEIECQLEEEKSQRKQITASLVEKNTVIKSQTSLIDGMREQITFYDQKLKEFQEMLKKSNETCSSFSEQFDKVKKRLKIIENERQMFREKLEVKTKVAAEKIKENEKMTNKLVKLEKLCRALQTERNSLSKNLRDIKRDNSSLDITSSISSKINETNSVKVEDKNEVEIIHEKEKLNTDEICKDIKENIDNSLSDSQTQ